MNEQLNDVERVFLAFADKTRLQLLYLLRDGEVSVNALCEALETSQPKVSRHLAYLRAMEMVTTRRDGKSIYYKLHLPSSPFGASVVGETIDWLDSFSASNRGPERQRPSRRLVRQISDEPPLYGHDDQPNESAPHTKPEPQHVERELEVYLL